MRCKFLSIMAIALIAIGSLGAIDLTTESANADSIRDIVSGEVIVSFTDETDVSQLNIGSLDPVFYKEIVSKIDGLNIVVVKVPTGLEDKFVEKFAKSSLVSYAETNGIVRKTEGPDDPAWDKQWGPENIKCLDQWATGWDNENSVVLAIIDTGIDLDHEDLVGRLWDDGSGNHGRDIVNGDDDPDDDEGHGTHCAGIAAATTNNGVGIAGVAGNYPVRLMAVKVLDGSGSGSSVSVAAGINWAKEHDADVISMSLGSTSNSTTIYNACKAAFNAGIVVCAAAGNDGVTSKHYPAGNDDCVIAVAATTSQDNLAYFSNHGDWVDIAAPGDHIYSSVPNDQYAYHSGTSMACPHVAGVAAMAVNSGWGRQRIWDEFEDTADDIGVDVAWGKVDATFDDGLTPPPEEIEVFVTINEISCNYNNYPGLDYLDFGPPLGDGESPEWFYKIISKSGGQAQQISTYNTETNQNSASNFIKYWTDTMKSAKTWSPSSYIYTLNTYNDDYIVDISIKLYDHDDGLSGWGDDMADISSKDNGIDGDLLGTEKGRTFKCAYDVVSHKIISGDEYVKDGDTYIIRGDSDGSTGPEIPLVNQYQDDARMEFEISDSYDPTADGGESYSGLEGIDISFRGSGHHGIGPYTYKWTFGDETTSTKQNPDHTYSSSGTYYASLKITDSKENSHTHSGIEVSVAENQKPDKPSRPSGTSSPSKDTEYTYKFKGNDPNKDDGDKLIYGINWNWKMSDPDHVDQWTSTPVIPNSEIEITHTFISIGNKNIKVRTKDLNGVLSDWSDPLAVSVPRSRPSVSPLLEKLQILFPNLFIILENILDL